jgi:hypothetical protein
MGECGRCLNVSISCPVTGSCGNGNEPSGSIKFGEFLDHLSDCHLFEVFDPRILVRYVIYLGSVNL